MSQPHWRCVLDFYGLIIACITALACIEIVIKFYYDLYTWIWILVKISCRFTSNLPAAALFPAPEIELNLKTFKGEKSSHINKELNLSSCELSRTLNLISATFFFTEMASFVNANLDSDSDSDDQVRFFFWMSICWT